MNDGMLRRRVEAYRCEPFARWHRYAFPATAVDPPRTGASFPRTLTGALSRLKVRSKAWRREKCVEACRLAVPAGGTPGGPRTGIESRESVRMRGRAMAHVVTRSLLVFMASVAAASQADASEPKRHRTTSDLMREPRAASLLAEQAGAIESSSGGPHPLTAPGAAMPLGPVADALAWLESNQNPDGSWGSAFQLIVTGTVIETLTTVAPGSGARAAGATWLAAQMAANHEFLARQIIALADVAGHEGRVSDLTDDLLAARNPEEPDPGLPNWPEGGWGIAPGFETDCLTTALAMEALDAVGLNGGLAVNAEPIAASATHVHEWTIPSDATKVRILMGVVGSTLRVRMKEGFPPGPGDPYFELSPGNWLIIFPDFGIPFTPGQNFIGIQNVGAAGSYTMTASYETPTFDTQTLAEPLAYLRESQNVDGGWGLQRGQATDFYTTLHVLLALRTFQNYGFETELADGIAYVLSLQLMDGSFGYDGTPVAYVTALATINLLRAEAYPFSTETENAVSALLAMRDVGGSWAFEAYDTALAMLALDDHNQAPTAQAGSDQMIVDAGEDCVELVTLDGTLSTDVDGTIVSYIWTENGTELASGPSPVITLAVGMHTLELTVIDDGGESASDTVVIDVFGTGTPTDVCHCCLPGNECLVLDALECLDSGASPAPGACGFEACCLPDGSCRVLDPVCCEAEGGTPAPGETCTQTLACCLPNGDCRDVDPVCCTLMGGAAQPPGGFCSMPEACCLADGACELLDPACCLDQGGIPLGAGNACATAQACCLPDGSCDDLGPDCCALLGGEALGVGTACTGPEACCLPDNTCQVLDPACCTDLGGAPRGPGSACTADQACCLPDDTCQMLDPECCSELSGTPQGAASVCTAPEACCLPGDTCQMLDPECCSDQGGTARGPGSTCTSIEACCLPDDTCQMLDPECCGNLGGTPRGPGTTCTTLDACCLPDDTCQMLDPLCCVTAGGTSLLGEVCTAPEACCFGDGTCQELAPVCCAAAGGTGGGAGTACLGDEACCLADSTCADIDATCCLADGGTPLGAGTSCGDPVACCFGSGSCQDLDEQCCLDAGGTPLDPGSICLGDDDSNGVDDACEAAAARPMPDSRFHIDGTTRTCSETTECISGLSAGTEAYCVPPPEGDGGLGVCYVRRNRYVSINPNPGNAGTDTARRVKLTTGEMLGWVGQPVEVTIAGPETSPQWLSRVESAAHYMDWSTVGTVHVGDCEISTGTAYNVSAIATGDDEGNEARYSEPLVLDTVSAFGDVVGGTIGLPPDADRNFKDISAVVRGFQSTQTEPKAWLDLQGGTAAPEIPDFSDINFSDINWAVRGFQGASYPFAAPCECPGQSCL